MKHDDNVIMRTVQPNRNRNIMFYAQQALAENLMEIPIFPAVQISRVKRNCRRRHWCKTASIQDIWFTKNGMATNHHCRKITS